jgi:hypothetical protein
MRIKRERWGHRYYIVARDEKGRILTRAKWTSNKDLLKERYSEVEKKVKTKRKGKRYILTGKRYILTSTAVTSTNGGDSEVFGITSYIEDIEITENHKAFLKELHEVLEEFCESIDLDLTGSNERTEEDIEDWKKWASSELEDLDKEDIRYWVEIDLEKWEIVNSHDEYLTARWQKVLDKWKGRL